MSTHDREHDILIYGASGFVGRLTAIYLAAHTPAGMRLALGGRSQAKLEQVRNQLGVDWPIVLAESADLSAVKALAESTAVVATTVGPYAKYGLPLAAACAAAGTHYADLTGEALFMRRSIDANHDTARRAGARIVHACGFDSIPSDLGVLLLARAGQDRDLGTLRQTSLVVRRISGGASGGTIDSMRGMIAESKGDPSARKLLTDPFALVPDRAAAPSARQHRDPVGVLRDRSLGGYLAPFFMGVLNSRVVHRSNALLGGAYGGPEFRYRELMLGGSGPLGATKAAGIVGGLAAFMAGMSLRPTAKLLDRVLPAPGEGPSERVRERGFFDIDVHADTSSGARLVCQIHADGDPGYQATAVMLGETALALAHDTEQLPQAAGVLTPATAIGEHLATRLQAAGQRYDVA